MDAKVSDLQDRLDRLAREEENLSAEVREMLPVSADVTALTGEKLAKYRWIESRLGEIQMWNRQLTEKLARIEREGRAGR